MIYDIDRVPKSITLLRLAQAGGRFTAPKNLGDVIPLVSGAVGDSRQWRPDVTTDQSWTFESSLPKAPLASGANPVNHARKMPITLSFSAMVTDTPLIPIGKLGGLPGIRRADALWASLNAIWRSRAFIALISPVVVLETAQIRNISLSRTPEDGRAFFFTIDIEEQQVFSLKLLANIDDAAAQNGGALTKSSGVVIGGI